MQSLSFASQVHSLGVAVRVRLAEQQRLDAERAALEAERARCAEKKKVTKKDRAPEIILAAMAPNRAYQWGELRDASGLDRTTFSMGMTSLVKKRRIDKTFDVRASLYSLPY